MPHVMQDKIWHPHTMPSFTDSFWSANYSSGINVVFEKLDQGCVENEEFISLFTDRMEFENVYANQLTRIPQQHQPNALGFAKDGGGSLRACFEGMIQEMAKEGSYHLQVADNIRVMVVEPFTKWAMDHRNRVEYSHHCLTDKVKRFEKLRTQLEKTQKRYFNKCRNVEDLKTEFENRFPRQDFAAYIEEQDSRSASPDLPEEISLGGHSFSLGHVTEIIDKMVNEIPQTNRKVPILGTYDKCVTGSQVTQWVQANLSIADLSKAELFGQDLLVNGYLRLVGQVGNSFANSSQLYYQWRPKAFPVDKLSNRPVISDYLEDLIGTRSLISLEDKQGIRKLFLEADELDKRYFEEVQAVDAFRCELEELILDHYAFMEKCEMDRLKALKKVTLDFVASVSNKITSLKAVVDRLMALEESVNPSSDMLLLISSYRTGFFQPKVFLYDNFYSSTCKQIFGVALDVRCSLDKKMVPVLLGAILTYLDMSVYPVMESDEARLQSWTESVKLQTTHEIRNRLEALVNDPDLYTVESIHEILAEYDPPVVTSILKLYLLELPDSLIPSNYYETIKYIYKDLQDDVDARLAALQNLLAELAMCNIATLDSVLTHFVRLISIVNLKNKNVKELSAEQSQISRFINIVAHEFSTLILRNKFNAKAQHGLNERHCYKLILDMIVYKDEIFGELKRRVSLKKKKSKSKSPAPSKPYQPFTNEEPVDVSSLKVDEAKVKRRSSSASSTLLTPKKNDGDDEKE